MPGLHTVVINSELWIMHGCRIQERNKSTSPCSCLNKCEFKFELSTSQSLWLSSSVCLLRNLNLCLPKGWPTNLSLCLYLCLSRMCLSVLLCVFVSLLCLCVSIWVFSVCMSVVCLYAKLSNSFVSLHISVPNKGLHSAFIEQHRKYHMKEGMGDIYRNI